jgi:tetratricopeptide (TPR) repeat protein
MEKLADSYRRRGLYAHAERIIQKVFEVRQKIKGLDHPELAYYHNDLGLLQAEQGKYLAAESNFLRAIAITETHSGSDNPDLADVSASGKSYSFDLSFDDELADPGSAYVGR